MTEAEQLGMQTIFPNSGTYTWKYYCVGPSGPSQVELTVMTPELTPKVDWQKGFAAVFWNDTVALATSADTRVSEIEYVGWPDGGGERFTPASQLVGAVQLPVADPQNAAVLVLHSRHADPRAARRLTFPGTPAAWVTGRQLNQTGMRAMENWSHAMIEGMGGWIPNNHMLWLVPHPRILTITADNPTGVGFRRVEDIYVMQDTRPMTRPTFGIAV